MEAAFGTKSVRELSTDVEAGVACIWPRANDSPAMYFSTHVELLEVDSAGSSRSSRVGFVGNGFLSGFLSGFLCEVS